MLYVTTREKYDAYTAARTLAGDCAPDGGWYLPFRMPYFDENARKAWREASVCQCIAQILNLFFSTKLTGWDVETAIGRNPVRIQNLGQKILLSELWRNLEGSYDRMEAALAARIHADKSTRVTSWLRIAIRISLLCATYAELSRQQLLREDDSFDVAVPADDLNLAMAVWYSREMGLPVGNILCSCSKNSSLWDLLYTCQCRADVTSKELERLIFGTLGIEEAQRFAKSTTDAAQYRLLPEAVETLRKGMFAAVVSEERASSVISSVYRNTALLIEPEAAQAFAGVMDYRAKLGESRLTLLLSDHSPVDFRDTVANALNISKAQLEQLLGKA